MLYKHPRRRRTARRKSRILLSQCLIEINAHSCLMLFLAGVLEPVRWESAVETARANPVIADGDLSIRLERRLPGGWCWPVIRICWLPCTAWNVERDRNEIVCPRMLSNVLARIRFSKSRREDEFRSCLFLDYIQGNPTSVKRYLMQCPE